MAQWNALGLAPSRLCTDAEFIRRASIDITGTLPTAEQVRRLRRRQSPDKRPRLVDDLLERPEYADYFAIKWADILRNKREQQRELSAVDLSILRLDPPPDRPRTPPSIEFTRQILAASGTPETAPATVWYRDLSQPDQFVDDAAQVFLGMRLQCAKCHHHPFEKWSQDDYYGFAAFFGRVGRKDALASKKSGRDELVIFNQRGAAGPQPQDRPARWPRRRSASAEPVDVAPTEDPRDVLVDWLAEDREPVSSPPPSSTATGPTSSAEGWSSRSTTCARRTRRPTPHCSTPCAEDFVAHGYDLKHLIRTICNSRLYGLSQPAERDERAGHPELRPLLPEADDRRGPARRHGPRHRVPNRFDGLPVGTRAIELPDESVRSDFLDTFGRPQRETACSCERIADASLSQSLMLLNSAIVQARLADDSGRRRRTGRRTRGRSRRR